MAAADVIVIGGGIAGLSAAFHLARAGMRVRLLEQEALFATHSSGRNAAIFRQVGHRPDETALARLSRTLLDELVPGWLNPQGALYVANEPAALAALAARLPSDLRHEIVGRDALVELAPLLRGGDADAGVFFPSDGVIDTHRVLSALASSAREAGAELSLGTKVRALRAEGRARSSAKWGLDFARPERDFARPELHSAHPELVEGPQLSRAAPEGGRVTGVFLEDGQWLPCAAIVLGAGAWAAALGASVGAPLPLVSFRRHLAHLALVTGLGRHPIVWRLDDEVYFRPEAGGVLASPCDEMQWPAQTPAAQPEALLQLAHKLERLAPSLAAASVRTSWAGLRTFAPDRGSVIGADPRVGGLYWLAGLGGHGMTCGAAAGSLIASAIQGHSHPLAEALSPGRLL